MISSFFIGLGIADLTYKYIPLHLRFLRNNSRIIMFIVSFIAGYVGQTLILEPKFFFQGFAA